MGLLSSLSLESRRPLDLDLDRLLLRLGLRLLDLSLDRSRLLLLSLDLLRDLLLDCLGERLRDLSSLGESDLIVLGAGDGEEDDLVESLPLLPDLLSTDLLLLLLFRFDSSIGAGLGLRLLLRLIDLANADARVEVELSRFLGEDLSLTTKGSARPGAEGSTNALLGAGEGLRLSSDPLRDRDRLPMVSTQVLTRLGNIRD